MIAVASAPYGIVPVGSTPAIDIEASEPVHFLCRLDDEQDFAPCTPESAFLNGTHLEYANIAEGPHTLRVVALDRANGHSNTLVLELSADDCILTSGLCKHNNLTALNQAGSCGPGFFLDLSDRNICRGRVGGGEQRETERQRETEGQR